MPHAEVILFQEMLPLIDMSNEDIQLFQDDPLEFIRREEDRTINPVKRDAADVVEMLIHFSANGKSFLIKFVEYAAVSLLDSFVDMRRKVTLLQLIAKFKTEILKNPYLKKDFGNFMVKYFFPFLADPNPILVSACCDLLEVYLVSIPLDVGVVQQLISRLYECLQHQYTVVKFKSILAFTSLLDGDSEAVQYVRPHFEAILKIYVTLIDQIDHEKLLKSLERIVEFFDKEILTYGSSLIKHLLVLFYKHLSKEQD